MVANATAVTMEFPTLEPNVTESVVQITKTKNVPLSMPPPSQPSWKDKDDKTSNYYVNPKDLEKLQQSIDIVSLIECYNIPQFTRSGDKASCLCPFHDDHNPSLKIDGNRGIFKCFSCGVGGNALRFVREYAKVHGTELSFLEAVKLLDDMVATTSNDRPLLPVSITVPMGARPPARYGGRGNVTKPNVQTVHKTTPNSPTVGTTPRERVLLANFHAAAYFEECLLTRVEAGSARAHLRRRGISPNTVRAFGMGFAPESYFGGQQQPNKAWGEKSLVHFLRDKGFSPQEIVDAGLAIRTKRGKQQLEKVQNDGNGTATAAIAENDYTTLMDRFRGRLVVPIFDEGGKFVLGFGGRILESATSGSDFKSAKYLNSPESIVFQKKRLLFGQHMAEMTPTPNRKDKAKPQGAQPLIVVEGYMDVIAMWQAGIRETVASMGTALSLDQFLSAAISAKKLGGKAELFCG
jgi:DNA primase